LIDGLLAIGCAVPISFLLEKLRNPVSPLLRDHLVPINPNASPPSLFHLSKYGLGWGLLAMGLGYLAFIAINWSSLRRTGQTIGKKVAKTRVASMDGTKPGMSALIVRRSLVFNLFQLIPNLGAMVSLVDIMLIFRADRRCLHDLVAGTQVVKFKAGEVIP